MPTFPNHGKWAFLVYYTVPKRCPYYKKTNQSCFTATLVLTKTLTMKKFTFYVFRIANMQRIFQLNK